MKDKNKPNTESRSEDKTSDKPVEKLLEDNPGAYLIEETANDEKPFTERPSTDSKLDYGVEGLDNDEEVSS